MRILIVISGLGFGGAERQVVLLSTELVRRGHAVCIVALTDIVPRASELAGTGVELVVDPKKLRLDLAVLWRLRRRIGTWQPDVVHGFLFDGNLYARLAAIGTGVPVLDSERSDNYRVTALQSLGYRMTAGWTRGVVANTHAGAAFASRLHGARAGGEVHVVWNGIDLAEIDARLLRSGRTAHQLMPGTGLKRVCVVGRVKPEKDYNLALRVARRLIDLDPAWRFLCVGETQPYQCLDYADQVLADHKAFGLQKHVSFVGNRRDVPEIIASCDALLITSTNEGFPNVVLEAMACGTPVVSTDYSDVRRILPHAWQVVASREPDDLAEALARCLAEREAVARAQRRWVELHATVKHCADSLLGAYAACLSYPAASQQSAR